MHFIVWALNEIKEYGLWLIPFFAIPIAGALRFEWKGLLAGHCLVAFCIAIFDYRWIQSEIRKPGWDGLPDMDLIFYFGVLARVVTINVLSLPCAIASIIAVKRRVKRESYGR